MLEGFRANFGDRLFKVIVAAFATLILVLVALIIFELAVESLPSIKKFSWRFLVATEWDPVKEKFGALTFIFGTLVSSLLAILLAAPLGLGVAVYLVEIAPKWLRGPVSFMVELLAAIPSVVYGLWGLFVLAPWLQTTLEPLLARYLGWLPFFQGTAYGVGMLAGGIILSIMILPTIVAISREVIAAAPRSLREGALALGSTHWEMIRGVVLPYGRSGIVGAIMLGLGRALGETMAVTMVIGNRSEISASLFSPAQTMASVIANEFTEATSNLYLSALVEVGLILFAITIALNIAARLLIYRLARATKLAARR